jgi:hypothetical protein
MASTVFGVFGDRLDADQAVADLVAANVPKGQLHLERISPETCQRMELTEDERRRFSDAVQDGAILVRAKVPDDQAQSVRIALMKRGGTIFHRSVSEDVMKSQQDYDVSLLTPGSFAHREFEEHFLNEYGARGEVFADYLPAYEFGYHFGTEAGYENTWKDWNQVWHEARRRWELDHPGTWAAFELAIQEGWATAPARMTSASMM